MSIEIMSQVWKQSRVTDGRQLLALLALADWSDEFGASYPKYAKIATRARVSERQAIRLINDLIKSGEVCNPKVKHNHRSNLFIVLTGAESREDVRVRLENGIKLHGGTIDPISLDNLVESIFTLRKGDTYVTLNNEASDNEHDTHVTHDPDIDVTPTVTHVSPNPLYIRQPDPSVTNNSVAADAPPPPPVPVIADKSSLPNDIAKAKTLDFAPPSGSRSRKAPTPDAAAPPSPSELKPSEHPFVQVYREVFQRYPNKAQMAQLVKLIVNPPGLVKWREACSAWLMAGYKPDNLRGILDWYGATTIPQYTRVASGGTRNYRAPTPPPNSPYATMSEAEKAAYLASCEPMED